MEEEEREAGGGGKDTKWNIEGRSCPGTRIKV